MNKTANGRRIADQVRVVLPTRPVGDATLEQLQGWLQSTFRVENQLAGFRAGVLAELTRREGVHVTENDLREKGLRPRRKARSEVETAVGLEELPKTSEGMRDGEIPYENARILAKASQDGEIDEDELIGPAKTQSPDKFSRTVRKHQQQRSSDDGMSRLEHQRSQRFAKIRTSTDDGMTVLYGRFDPITGALIETALSQKMDELWREEDPRARCTPGQRMADALAQLVTREETREDGKPPRGPRLLLIADYDVIDQELRNGRLGDGTPIPVEKIRDLACQSEILPAIFKGVSQPLDLGRGRRAASPAQRIALVARDKALCRDAAPPLTGASRITLFPGRCKATPTSTTCVCYAAGATTKYMMTDGLSANRQPESTTSNHQPNATDQQPPGATEGITGAAAAPSNKGNEPPPGGQRVHLR